jgi:ABC-2 type transport system ATP-binding protein
MRRRLSIALACASDPAILLLDEPSVGLDPENKRLLWEIILDNRARRAVVLTTHSM